MFGHDYLYTYISVKMFTQQFFKYKLRLLLINYWDVFILLNDTIMYRAQYMFNKPSFVIMINYNYVPIRAYGVRIYTVYVYIYIMF